MSCGSGEIVNGMKIHSKRYDVFTHKAVLKLQGKNARHIQEKDYMAVSPMKRAAEGETYNVTIF
jgi:hypothetical protein